MNEYFSFWNFIDVSLEIDQTLCGNKSFGFFFFNYYQRVFAKFYLKGS